MTSGGYSGIGSGGVIGGPGSPGIGSVTGYGSGSPGIGFVGLGLFGSSG